jgi:hypothetical protein
MSQKEISMKDVLKTTTLVLLFLVGTGFFFRYQGDKLTASITGSNNEKMIAFEREGETAALPANEDRTKPLPVGQWGGQHISMDVTARGATVEYDCAHATIERKITVDRHGRFDVSGMQSPERGGPVRQGQDTGYAVRFKGQVNGKTMTLNVTNTLTKELIGTFTLIHGAEPRLMKCK